MTLQEVERCLDAILQQAHGCLPDEQISDMRGLVAAGEPGVALENFCVQLEEYDVVLPAAVVERLSAVAAAMKMTLPAWMKRSPSQE